MIEITGDKELKRLIGIDNGFLLSVNFLTKNQIIHRINCKFCDPENDSGIKPSNKIQDKSGEVWFSNKHNQILVKAEEFNIKGHTFSLCKICIP